MTSKKDFQVEKALDDIHKLKSDISGSAKLITLEGFKGEYSEFPKNLSKEIINIYKKKGINKLFSHQKDAIEAILKGKNVVVSTPTASGKTLIYNSVTFNSLLTDKSSKSLYLFPTKALSQDQLSELFDLNKMLGDKLGLFTYDGDTPQTARKAIRKQAQIVITNPYMLHSGILPHHTKWINLFENLKYVIIDELHYYTGVFGSHMGNIIRRLKRICSFYGSDPVFIMSSATISNPRELAEMVTEEKVILIENSGAPRGKKYIVFLNPPIVNKQLGIRQSYISLVRKISGILLKNKLSIITFTNARLVTEILVKYLKNDFERNVNQRGIIRGYRGGYLPAKRREIERGLKSGKIKGVVSTNALELGIDIGSLDGVVLASYPGTISSTWQRLGRAGRRSSSSLGILVASSSPINQYIINHPEYFTGKSPETGRINPDNLTILIDHIKCAAFELPFFKGEKFSNEDLVEILDYLSENRVLLKRDEKWFWSEEGYPADAVSINRISSDNFVVVDTTSGEKVIAKVNFSSALETLHEKAIYILEGEQYVVEKLDFDNRKAFVTESISDYYTDAITNTKISILDIFDNTDFRDYSFSVGDVHVYSQVVGFKKLKFFTNENVGSGNLQLPQREMHSTAFWMTIKKELLDSIKINNEDKIEAVNGIAYLMRHISAVMLMSDIKDLGVSVEDNITKKNINLLSEKFQTGESADKKGFEPNIYIYDSYPNGVGFSEVLYKNGVILIKDILATIENCDCPSGCPSCVGPPIRKGGKHKEASKFIVKSLAGKVYN